jgi:hypothetical protein
MKEKLEGMKLDKKSFSVVSLFDQMTDRDYWLGRSPIERMQHIEALRRINYGHRATSRLQRFFEAAER